MIKAGIIGGAGYTGGEALRLLLGHPEVQVVSVVSSSHAGEPVEAAHPDLTGDTNLRFSEELSDDCDVVFLCSGHGKSRGWMQSESYRPGMKVIDLSSDFRLAEPGNEFVYGLPELNRALIQKSDLIANPGCFATAIQLSLLPLAQSRELNEAVHVSAITGSTGAGQQMQRTTHFSWRSNNASAYKIFEHQHLHEIRQSLQQLQPGFGDEILFVPMRGAFTRGIFSVSYTRSSRTEHELLKLYEEYFRDHPFVHLATTEPDVKQVVGTNKALIHLTKKGDHVVVSAVIDNLLKGASGQAVQNMNLMFGLDETLGLQLKAGAF